jgi:predicted dehydrogenase
MSKSNRRQFLQGSAKAALGTMILPSIVPSSVLGMNGKVPPSDRIVMGSIGTGSQGNWNMENFLRFKEVQYVALCDVDANHLAKAQGIVNERYKNSDCRVYEDYREFLEKEKLDAVCISVPDHWHSLTYIAAAEKKINIWGEKPLARSIGEGKAIVKAVQKNDIIWQTGSWQRSVENFRHAAELAFNGRIGKIKYAEVGLPDGGKNIGTPPVMEVPEGLNWEFWLGSAPKVPYRGVCHWDWRWILDYSGGQLTDWAGHHIDIAHWGLGLDRTGPIEVEGAGVYPEEGIFDVPIQYDFICKYANGIKIRVASASRLKYGMGAVWYGETGWIHVDRGRSFASDPKILEEKIGAGDTPLYKSDDHWQNFLECIKSHQQTITPAEVAHRSISVGLLGEIAMTTGQKIQWDPEKEEIIGNERASRLLNRPMRQPWAIPAI